MSAVDDVRLTDFRLAGFLVARGHRVVETVVNDRGDVEFRFAPDARPVLSQYPGSPEAEYDAACKSMHALVRATLGRTRPRR